MNSFFAVALDPESTDLAARARPRHSLPLAGVEVVQAGEHRVEMVLRFGDNYTLPWAIERIDDSWLLSWGTRPINVYGMRHSLEVVQESDRLLVSVDAQSFSLDLVTGRFSLRNGEDVLLESPDGDLLVGNLEMSPPHFLHEGSPGVSLQLHRGERIYGGGEDFGSILKNGRVFDVLNCDALGSGGQYRYQSTPVFWSSRGVGWVVLDAAPSRLDFGFRRHEILGMVAGCPQLNLLVTAADSAEGFIRGFREHFAPPRAVPEWSLGLWLSRCFYRDQAEVMGVLDEATRRGIRVGVVNLDARCWMRAETRTDFVWDESRFEPFASFIPKLRQQGVRVCLWENPYVSSATETLYAEGVAKGFFAKNSNRDAYAYQWVPPGLKGFPQPPISGLVDFTNPLARLWWKDLHRPFLRAGVSSFKTDFGEEIPNDAMFFDGRTGWELRNIYSDLYNDCVTEVLDEELDDDGIVWARSGWMRASANPVKWAGDSQATWRGLRATLRAGLSQAVGGAVFWSHDIGGFYGPKPDGELYLRWAQVGLWGSHARCHGTTPREPWEFGDAVTDIFKESLAMRHHLLPYFLDECAGCVESARSFVLPLWLAFSDDLNCVGIDDAFMAGCHVLVAPYLDAQGGREVYLPAGDWIDLRTGHAHSGGRWVKLQRHRHIPAFARMGTHFDLLFRGCSRILG